MTNTQLRENVTFSFLELLCHSMYCCLLAREHWAYTCHGEGLAVSGKLYAFAVRGRDSRIAANDTTISHVVLAVCESCARRAAINRVNHPDLMVLVLNSVLALASAFVWTNPRTGQPITVDSNYPPPADNVYNTSAGPVEGKINIHLVPHTHDDTGP